MRAIQIAFLVGVGTLALGTPRPALAADACGDGVDNDNDGFADDGCMPQVTTGVCESPLDCGDTGAVSPGTGALTYELPPDLSPEVPYGLPIEFRRIYTSMYAPGGSAPAYRKPMGERWQHPYMSWLDLNTGKVVLHTPQGQDVLFTYGSTAGGYDYYTPQPGFHVVHLRQATSSPNKWELKTLEGRVLVYDWSSPTGKLIEMRDSLATPNVVTIAYDGNDQVSTVTDASTKRRLLFSYTSGKLTSVAFQTNGGSWTTQVTASYGYAGSDLTSLSIGGSTVHTYTYASNYLTKIEDAASNDVLVITYLTATAGKVVRIESPEGTIGYEYGPSQSTCSGSDKTLVAFNKASATTCDSDSDCGSDMLCGGETDPSSANTGRCFYAGRCMTVTSPNEDLVTTVTPVDTGANSSCTGACTDIAEYSWDTASGKLDLKGVKDPDNAWSSHAYNSNGLPTVIETGDGDDITGNDPGGIRRWYRFYGDSDFPGLVTEVRRKSDKPNTTCTDSDASGCAQTLYTYNDDGLLQTREEKGWTLDSSNSWVSYDYTTTYTYDTKGRLTRIDGPLTGVDDFIDLEYWSSTDVLKDGFVRYRKRKKDSTNYLTTEAKAYDFWGKATELVDVDGTLTCQTYDAARGYLTERRETMAGQTSCTSNSADLVTKWARDSWLRLTRLDRPDGGCVHYGYGSAGLLATVKRRDDCNTASSGDTTEYTYGEGDLITKIELKDAAGTVKRRQEYTYYDSRRLKQVKNPVDSSLTLHTYNTRGLLATIEAPSSLGKIEMTFDGVRREGERRFYTSASTHDDWDLNHGFQDSPTSITDEDNKSNQPTYDDLGRRVRLVTPDTGTTLFIHDAAGRITTRVEAYGVSGTQTHTMTYDYLGRLLTEDLHGTCGTGAPTEIQYVYDAPPVTCPTGADCAQTEDRVAYARATLLCSTSYGDNALDQETFYSYDDAGRVIREYIRDDAGRTANQPYTWDKSGGLASLTTPTGASISWTYGDSGNSDVDRISEVSRGGGVGVVADDVVWYPFGDLKSYRHKNQTNSNDLQTVITRNLAYRVSDVLVERVTGTDLFRCAITEDAKGRVTARDYTGGDTNMHDSYFLYDWLDRITCERTTSGSNCPTTNTNLKNNINGGYTASNDRDDFLRGNAFLGMRTFTVALLTGKDQLDYVTEPNPTGLTDYGWDVRGNRTYDDLATSTIDRRDFTYDGRQRLATVQGKFSVYPNVKNYTLVNAYDQRDRRVFKSFKNTTDNIEAQWFFYYDALDRLVEIKHTPDINSSSTYSIYQLHWIEDRLFLYYQTDYPSGTVSRRYVHTDESGRPVELYSWPASGDATRVWAIDPDAWGADVFATGSTLFQPVLFAGQYRDPETVAFNGVLEHRPPLALERGRGYDPFVGLYLQADRNGWWPYVFGPMKTRVSYESARWDIDACISFGDADSDIPISYCLDGGGLGEGGGGGGLGGDLGGDWGGYSAGDESVYQECTDCKDTCREALKSNKDCCEGESDESTCMAIAEWQFCRCMNDCRVWNEEGPPKCPEPRDPTCPTEPPYHICISFR